MASNKNQHFVPKVYLRSFSADEGCASINLFNITSHRSIPGASIKGQCSSNYFYGEDDQIEQCLQTFESRYGLFLRDLSSSDFYLTDDGKTMLRHFVLLQHLRTSALAKRHEAFIMEMVRTGFEGQPPPEYIPNAKETARLAMEHFAQSKHLVDDLKVKLARNDTEIDFAASDAPSVHTNRWHLQSPKAKGQSPGILNAGIVFLMPITPRCLVIVYDGDVYTIEHTVDWVSVARDDDVERLNEHQFLNCDSNIYFANWASRHSLEAAYDRIAYRRPAVRHAVVTAILDKVNADGTKRYKPVPHDQAIGKETILHASETFAVPSRWPSFLRLRNRPLVYSNETATGFVRAWTAEHDKESDRSYKRVKL